MLPISAPKNQSMKDYADSQKWTKKVRNTSGYIQIKPKLQDAQLLPFDSCSIHHFYNNFPPFNTSSIFDKHVSSQLPVCFLPFGAVHHLLPSMLSHSDVADLPS